MTDNVSRNSPRPSDAHIHISVRSNASASASSLPSLVAGRAGGRGSINTTGYLLTAPMSHQTTASSYSNPRHHHHHHRRQRHSRWDQWGHRHDADASNSGAWCCGFKSSRSSADDDDDGRCCSRFEDERLPVMENNVRFA